MRNSAEIKKTQKNFYKILFYYFKNLCYNIFWWCSILVSAARSQDGPKNPLKGISMKFLVLAFDAQSGVGAGS